MGGVWTFGFQRKGIMGSTEPLGRGRRLDHPSVRMAKFVARLVSTPAAGQGGATRRARAEWVEMKVQKSLQDASH